MQTQRKSLKSREKLVRSGEAAATPPGMDTTVGRTLTTTWDVGCVLLDANYVPNGVFLINEVKGRSF